MLNLARKPLFAVGIGAVGAVKGSGELVSC